jgi:hypothetical protein
LAHKPALYSLGRGVFLALLVALTAVLVSGRATRAQAARKQFMGIGVGMMQLFDGPETGLRTALVLNGERLVYTRGRSDRSVAALLDEAEARCGRGDGVLGKREAIRDDDGQRGFMACLPTDVLGPSRGDRPTYLYAEVKGDRTRWLALEVDGVLDLFAMFPKDKDAPGIDLGGVPRPEGSRRVLSSYGEGFPYAMAIYSQSGTPESLAAHYRDALARVGWHQVGAMQRIEGDAVSFAAARGHRWISVTLVPDGQGAVNVVVLGDHGGAA